VRARLDALKDLDFDRRLAREELKKELDDVLVHFPQLLQQCRRRVIEGEKVSAGKRAFGIDRCTWRGWEGFKSYVWLAIATWNLQVLARHLLS